MVKMVLLIKKTAPSPKGYGTVLCYIQRMVTKVSLHGDGCSLRDQGTALSFEGIGSLL